VCPVLVYAYRLINRLSANEVYISSGRAEMDRSYPFDRASTTSRAIRIPSRSRAILLFHSIFYKYNSYLQLSHIAIILQGAAQTSMATAIQYQIIEAYGRPEKRPKRQADLFCMSGSQGQPVPPIQWDRLPLTSAHTKRIGFHFSTSFRSFTCLDDLILYCRR